MRALIWPLFPRSAWAKAATELAVTIVKDDALASVRLFGVGSTSFGGTKGECAALNVYHLFGVGSAKHCFGGRTVEGANLAPVRSAKRGQSGALTCLARHHGGLLSRCRTSEQRPEQRHHLSCPPTQWLAYPSTTKRLEARAAHSPVVPITTLAG